MRMAAEYKHHAHECREQAKLIQSLEDKDALERLARLWEKMADVREQHPELELGLQNPHSPSRTAAQ
jgi:hypothetical protein